MCARCYLWVTGSCGFSSNRKSSCVVGASICFLSVFLLLCTVNAVCHTHSGKRKHSQHTGELKYSSEHTRLCLCLRFTRWSCSPPPARTYPRASVHQAAITVNRLISHSHKAEFSSLVVVHVFCKMWKLPWQKNHVGGGKKEFRYPQHFNLITYTTNMKFSDQTGNEWTVQWGFSVETAQTDFCCDKFKILDCNLKCCLCWWECNKHY